MRIEEEVIETELIYYAEDGKYFRDEAQCLAYEKYCNLSYYQILKDYCIFPNPSTEEKYKNNKRLEPGDCLIFIKRVPEDAVLYSSVIKRSKHIPYQATRMNDDDILLCTIEEEQPSSWDIQYNWHFVTLKELKKYKEQLEFLEKYI